MNRVTLPATDLTASRLGFGTAGGHIDDARRLHLYRTAFDRGITHFDTARAYGVGGAERVLAKFLAGRRDQVTVATKLGIVPPPSGRLLRLAKRAGRTAERLLPSAGAQAKQVAGSRLLRGGRFAVNDARASLETSLRELGTDYVDLLLLHECTRDDIHDDLMTFLDDRVRGGQVRFTGIATGPESTASIIQDGSRFPTVVQVANGAIEPNLARLPLQGKATITHSPFSPGLRSLHAVISASSDLQRRWARELQADCSDPRTLSSLMLAYALWTNRHGIVLFSSQREDHIIADAVTASGPPPFPDETLAAFSRLARVEGRP